MALLNQPKPIAFVQTMGLAAGPLFHGVEKAAQSYKRGSALQDDDAGRIAPPTSPVDGGAVTRRVLGFAESDATGVTGADVTMILASAYTIFEGTLSDATATTHTLAQADQFQTFPITKATTHWYLDANAVTANGALVIGFKDAIGTVDGRVYFIVTTAARGSAHAASGTF